MFVWQKKKYVANSPPLSLPRCLALSTPLSLPLSLARCLSICVSLTLFSHAGRLKSFSQTNYCPRLHIFKTNFCAVRAGCSQCDIRRQSLPRSTRQWICITMNLKCAKYTCFNADRWWRNKKPWRLSLAQPALCCWDRARLFEVTVHKTVRRFILIDTLLVRLRSVLNCNLSLRQRVRACTCLMRQNNYWLIN